MRPAQQLNRIILIAGMVLLFMQVNAQNDRPFIDSVQYKIIRVKPTSTNPAIHVWDSAHIIYYDPAIKSNKILLWLTGTGGSTRNVPVEFFKTALGQGYRVIALSFISVPAVSQVCVGDILDSNAGCAASFRRKRIYGDNDFSLISDEPQDAIIPRFVKLLQWLVQNDAGGNWQQYLNKNDSKPAWNKIAIAGQSQGGGMAQYIGQLELLARVISFSGGWDYSNSREKKIADWYFNKAVTPIGNWYATYHVDEMAAKQLGEICEALKMLPGHIFALDKPQFNMNASADRPNPYHGEGIRNPVYKPIWITMLGNGVD